MAGFQDYPITDPSLFPSPASLSYSWHIKQADAKMGRREVKSKVTFRHCPVSGAWVLLVNGVFQLRGQQMISNRKFDIPFFIESKDRGMISLDGEKSVGYTVTCTVNDIEYVENRQNLDISMDEHVVTICTVPGYRVEQSTEQVVFYQLFVKTTSGEEFMLEKRYSEINFLDGLVRSATASHMVNSLPSLPGKVWNPFTDQTTETFIYKRRMDLEMYFNMLIGNAKVVHYQDVMAFFNLDVLTGLPKSDGARAAAGVGGSRVEDSA